MSKLAEVLFREYDTAHSNQESLDLVKQALKIDAKDPEMYLLLGKIMDRKSQWQEAIDAVGASINCQSEISKGQPPKANMFFVIGGVQEKAKDYKKAILNYKKCLTLDNQHFGACIHLANLLANVGEGQRAAKYFKHAIKVASDDSVIGKEAIVNAYFGLGKTLQQYSDNKDAPIAPLTKVVTELDPTHYKAFT